MIKRKKIPIQEIREYLDYREDSGKFYWIKKPSAKVYIGAEAGRVDRDGYRVIWFKGKKYLAHRIAWAFFHEEVPDILDHINGSKDDNRLVNLRETDSSYNARNLKKPSSASRVRNVHRAYGSKWGVSIKLKDKVYHFGTYDDLELAELIASEVQDKYFKGVYRTEEDLLLQ